MKIIKKISVYLVVLLVFGLLKSANAMIINQTASITCAERNSTIIGAYPAGKPEPD